MDGTLRKISPLALSIAMLTATAALAGDENFDTAAPGTLPADWICGVTGKGSPVWKVEADASAPSKPNVLKQSGTGTFPWCVKQSAQITDGFVEVKVQAARRPRRIRPAASYGASRTPTTITLPAPTRSKTMYRSITRRTAGASPSKYVDAPVAAQPVAHIARRVCGQGDQGRALTASNTSAVENDQIAGAGAVGVWTKADSVTAFDDFSYGGQ